ncbi:MAG: beta-propeller domain-containing protein, partial [Lachnospiraceae bacterium]|nr:beta-propeller domain-containing protein [Lachnospiraceae bacterium]
IKKSAEEIEVPEQLQPEAMEKMLEEEVAREPQHPFRWKKTYSVLVAAAMAVIIMIPAVVHPMFLKEQEPIAQSTDPQPPVTEPEPATKVPTITASIGDFGDTLHHPESYEEIYNATKEYQQRYYYYDEDVIMEDAESTDGFSLFGGSSMATEDAAKAETTTEAAMEPEAAYNDTYSENSYSKTNTVEEDVAEGDVTITDGKYIYRYTSDGRVVILGTQGGELTKETELDLESDGDISDISYIEDMYIQDNKLVIIMDAYRSYLKSYNKKESRLTNGDYIIAMVYDVTDATNPKMTGYTMHEGSFHSSRLVDGVLYLFTEKYTDDWLYDDAKYVEEDFLNYGVVPEINGEVAALDCIYMPQNYSAEPAFIMSSIDMDKPSKVVDYRVIMGYTSDVYVSRDAIYLESIDYSGSVNYTALVRMDYENGKFNPAGVGLVKGELLDAFAISEDKNGNLRVATTVTDYSYGINRSNCLTIFDSKMKAIGKLSGLANDEEIKSARYIGDYCYLVTFRNTDPLFTIDCSSPDSPILIGELKMPGFSDYLHPWGDGKLMGFGYAGNENGVTGGLKLSMFDISDPGDVEIISEKEIKDAEYSPALDDYKAIMVSADRGIVGFATNQWSDVGGGRDQYCIYRFDDGEFELEFAIDADDFPNMTRGIYIGNVFYLMGDNHAASFDMSNNYKKISDLRW